MKPSLYFNTATDKDTDNPSGQILRPLTNLEVIPIDIDKSYDELQQTDIMGQIGDGKTLLILGEPGSGKTIALLQLAERLIKLTQQDMTKPIPAVFNLSSWGQKQQPLEKWLIEELKDKYQVPKTWSEPWSKDQQLILLLDGLDEVEAKHRNACVRAINKFIATHLETEIVVCSRVKDYEALAERLLLNSAICLQPLSKKQLREFMENVDDSLLGLKTVIEQDQEIAEFARSPLILNMMTWTYQGWSVEQCSKQFRIATDREFNLFESYIEKNLDLENKDKKYPNNKVLSWLIWLAKKMIGGSKIIFLIEKMQPSWLPNKIQRAMYKLIVSIISGLIIGLLFGFIVGVISGPMIGLIFGLIVGPISGGIVGLGEIKTVEIIALSCNRVKKQIVVGLKGGLIGALSNGLTLAIIVLNSGGDSGEILMVFVSGLIYGLILGLIGGLIYGMISGLVGSEIEARATPNLGIRRSARNAMTYGFVGGLMGFLLFGLCFLIILLVGLIKELIESVLSEAIDMMIDAISIEPINAAVGVIYWLTSFSFKPIAGYIHSLPLGLEITFILVGGLSVSLFGGLTAGSIIGLIAGLIAGGGKASFQHLTLRFILYFNNFIPWNYARFLDYASERLLMKKVGGGYVFYHRMLMEHFAQRDSKS